MLIYIKMYYHLKLTCCYAFRCWYDDVALLFLNFVIVICYPMTLRRIKIQRGMYASSSLYNPPSYISSKFKIIHVEHKRVDLESATYDDPIIHEFLHWTTLLSFTNLWKLIITIISFKCITLSRHITQITCTYFDGIDQKCMHEFLSFSRRIKSRQLFWKMIMIMITYYMSLHLLLHLRMCVFWASLILLSFCENELMWASLYFFWIYDSETKLSLIPYKLTWQDILVFKWKFLLATFFWRCNY